MKKYYVNVQGGTGLNICLASIITAIKETYPDEYKFYVCSPYWDIFESCPAVDGVYKPQELRDLVYDAKANDGVIITQRLYDTNSFIYKLATYETAWCDLFGISLPFIEDENGQGMSVTSKLDPLPKFPYLAQQVADVKKHLKGKKFIITQFTGGQSPLVQVPADKNGQPDWSKVIYNYDNEPLKRHYPTEKAQEFINLFKQEHPDVEVIAYQLPNEPSYEGTFKFTMPYLTYYLLAKDKDCIGAVTIDSSLQHLIAGVTKNVVIWAHSINASNDGATIYQNPFGYNYNRNIVQPCRRDDVLFFSALGPSGAKVEYIAPAELLNVVDEHLFSKN